MAGHDPALLDELLNDHEGVGKVLGVLHRGHVVAHLAQRLRKGRAAQVLLVEGEVDMIDGGVLVVDEDGRDHLLDVADLSTGTDDDRSRRNNFLAVGILLRQ